MKIKKYRIFVMAQRIHKTNENQVLDICKFLTNVLRSSHLSSHFCKYYAIDFSKLINSFHATVLFL